MCFFSPKQYKKHRNDDHEICLQFLSILEQITMYNNTKNIDLQALNRALNRGGVNSRGKIRKKRRRKTKKVSISYYNTKTYKEEHTEHQNIYIQGGGRKTSTSKPKRKTRTRRRK